jgi:hypothetical protein
MNIQLGVGLQHASLKFMRYKTCQVFYSQRQPLVAFRTKILRKTPQEVFLVLAAAMKQKLNLKWKNWLMPLSFLCLSTVLNKNLKLILKSN